MLSSISQLTAGAKAPVAKAGHRAHVNATDIVDCALNALPQSAQVSTITVGGAPASGQAYTIIINGTTIVFSAPIGSPTTTTTAAAAAAKINATLAVRGQVIATSAAAVVTITGLNPGVPFTLTESEADLTTALVTTAVYASVIQPGLFVITPQHNDNDPEKLCCLPLASVLGTQIDSYVLSFENGVEIVGRIVVEGVIYEQGIDMATDVDTVGVALAAALNAILPANTVNVTYVAASDTLVMTSEVDGKAFASSIRFGVSRTTATAVKTSNASEASDISKAAGGITLRRMDLVPQTINGNIVYEANEVTQYIRRGHVWVLTSEVIVEGAPLFIQLETGLVFASAAADRIRLPDNNGRWKRYVAADGVGLIEVNFLP